MIIREEPLAWLRQLQDQKVIKAITGVRRAGKSTLLAQFREDLGRRGVKKVQIQSFNFEEERNADLLGDWRKLHQAIEARLVSDAMNYVFLDEVQKVPHFEEAAASLAAKENVDLYITGSNAFLLSGELATYLTGRYISLHLFPYSFAEYAQNFPGEYSRDLFDRYLFESSFPETVALAQITPQLATDYLGDLYNTVVERDISERYNLRNRMIFDRVVKFVCNSIGSPVSARKISAALAAERVQISPNTILQYLDYLSKSYLIYQAQPYDVRGKHILTLNDKFYLVDLGLRDLLLGERPESDLGHRLENVVFLELLRRKLGRVYVGKYGDEEVDFVVEKPRGEREYFQVAYTVAEPATLERELRPLMRIRDNYPKTIITHDTTEENFEGVRKVNVVDWLLGK